VSIRAARALRRLLRDPWPESWHEQGDDHLLGAHDTRVAILEDDQVVEIFIERENQRGVVGNIYKGRVSKVLPGCSRRSSTSASSATPFSTSLKSSTPSRSSRSSPAKTKTTIARRPRSARWGNPGGSRRGRQRRAAVSAAAKPADRREPRLADRRGRDRDRDRDQPQAKIEDLLKEGQEILVQVVKEPLGTKGARLTSHVTMPGRFLVFMPTVDHVGVSRKIESREERSRLRGIVKQFREQHGFTGGVIIRTAASGRSEADIVSDLSYFHEIWTQVRNKMENRRPPAVLFQEQSLVTKLLRDMLTDDYTAIRLDDEAEHRRVVTLVERIMPALLPRVKLYTKEFPIFEEYGIQAEIDKALRPRCGSSRAAISSSTRPRRWSPSTSTPGATSARSPAAASKTPSSRPTWKR
jgi:ribonuclease G